MTSVSSIPAMEARRLWNVVFTMLIDNNYNSAPSLQKTISQKWGKMEIFTDKQKGKRIYYQGFCSKGYISRKRRMISKGWGEV